MLAFAVTFTACDAHQGGLSTSYGFLLSSDKSGEVQMNRPEQKSTHDMTVFRPYQQAHAIQFALPAPRALGAADGFFATFISLLSWQSHVCLPLNSCESPRAPPLMDPPTFC